MEKLIECMLNEGIDEETIINVVEEYLNEGGHLNSTIYDYEQRTGKKVSKEAKKKASKVPGTNDIYNVNNKEVESGDPDKNLTKAQRKGNTDSSKNPFDLVQSAINRYEKRMNKSVIPIGMKVLGLKKSSESFDNVIDLVEGLLGLNEDLASQIIKVHGKPEYDTSAAIKPKNKSAKLLTKVWKTQDDEMNKRLEKKTKELTKKLKKEKKNLDSDDYGQIDRMARFQTGHDGSSFWIDNNHDTKTKNKVGEEKTFCRSCKVTGDSPGVKRRNRKSDTQRMVDSLARHRFKQEDRGSKEIDIPAFIRNYKRIMNTDSDNK